MISGSFLGNGGVVDDVILVSTNSSEEQSKKGGWVNSGESRERLARSSSEGGKSRAWSEKVLTGAVLVEGVVLTLFFVTVPGSVFRGVNHFASVIFDSSEKRIKVDERNLKRSFFGLCPSEIAPT